MLLSYLLWFVVGCQAFGGERERRLRGGRQESDASQRFSAFSVPRRRGWTGDRVAEGGAILLVVWWDQMLTWLPVPVILSAETTL